MPTCSRRINGSSPHATSERVTRVRSSSADSAVGNKASFGCRDDSNTFARSGLVVFSWSKRLQTFSRLLSSVRANLVSTLSSAATCNHRKQRNIRTGSSGSQVHSIYSLLYCLQFSRLCCQGCARKTQSGTRLISCGRHRSSAVLWHPIQSMCFNPMSVWQSFLFA